MKGTPEDQTASGEMQLSGRPDNGELPSYREIHESDYTTSLLEPNAWIPTLVLNCHYLHQQHLHRHQPLNLHRQSWLWTADFSEHQAQE